MGNQYLYWFRRPDSEAGNPERVYTLGSLGRDFLVEELGLAVDWYFRPEKARHLSFSQLTHNLTLTRVLVAACRFCALHTDFRLSELRTCYELGAGIKNIELDKKGKREQRFVIPDAWLLFEEFKGGAREHGFPVMLEIDRGTMYRERFKKHVLSRIEFVRSGAYGRVFRTKAVVIAYVSTGATGERQEGRREPLSNWTMGALRESEMENWAGVFRFSSVSLKEIYQSPLFEREVWYRPDQERPVGLFMT